MQLSYRQQVTFLGMLIGAVVGAIGAALWMDYLSDGELSETRVASLGFGDVARLATATLALVRQVNDLMAPKDE
jgi:L-cysteine desulfidase